MARPLREEFEGALWHVTSRGNDKKDIFFDDQDREQFLVRLARAAEVYGWLIHAYALMTNHFHLVVETPKTTLSAGMQWLNSCWAMDVNRRYGRTGHLFGERFKGILIDKECYALEVLRYVILNPVRAKMVERPEDYRWSSYRATAGLDEPPPWLAVDRTLLAFGQDQRNAQRAYQEFVYARLEIPSPFAGVVGQIFLGPREFIERMRERIEARGRSEDHPREQREIGRASASQIADVVCQVFDRTREDLKAHRVSAERLLAAWLARLQGQRLRPIATMLGLTSLGYVSDLVRLCGETLAKDRRLLQLANICRALIRELPPPLFAPPPLEPVPARAAHLA